MARNGSGVFTRTNGVNSGSVVWATDAATIGTISSSRHDTHDQDIATAIAASLACDGQKVPTANLPMSGFKHTQIGSGATRSANNYITIGELQDADAFWVRCIDYVSGVFTLTTDDTLNSIPDGMTIRFIPSAATPSLLSTVAPTHINLNSLGNTSIQLNISGGASCPIAFFSSLRVYEATYYNAKWYVNSSSLLIYKSSEITAAGSNQATATVLSGVYNRAIGGAGVILPSPGNYDGDTRIVTNATGSNLNLYPPVGYKFSDLATNAPLVVANNSTKIVVQYSGTYYYKT